MNKTLIGKENFLFLTNDSGQELKIHCDNLNLISDPNLSRYNFDKFLIVVLPNKSYIYRKYLPDNYHVKYRPALEIYKNKFNNKLIDAYDLLKDEEDVYYKTDTHINLKGNYIIYKNFIEKVNEIYNLNLNIKNIKILSKSCHLNTLKYGIGDLTWADNLGNQELQDINDTYYYSEDFIDLYNSYVIKDENDIRFLDYKIVDITKKLEEKNEFTRWEIVSNHIIYKKNIEKNDNPIKVVIFYDSFLLSILPLYLDLFYEVYMIKSIYDNSLINLIKPDYVFEFRVERFLF
jgi:hypothetical protein